MNVSIRQIVVTSVVAFALSAPPLSFSLPRQNENQLKSFYIATHGVSDAYPHRFEYILDINPKGNGVLVREIRVAPGKYDCPGTMSVRAVERQIKHASPRKIASVDFCSLSLSEVNAAIEDATPKGIAFSIDDTASYTIVAWCGKTERVFNLPYFETINFKRLKKRNPRVAWLYEVAGDIESHMFGKHFSFHKQSAGEEAASRNLGSQLISSIKSGIYDHGYEPGSLQKFLGDGPLNQDEMDPWTVKMAEPPELNWIKYQLPIYPLLAKQARITGDVELMASLNIQTGSVTDVKAISGHPLLQRATLAAVGKWEFRETNSPEDSVPIKFSFIYECKKQ